MLRDPIKKLEDEAKNIHDHAGRFAQPVLRRYPLMFALLLTFAFAAIIHGFELLSERIPIFEKHPLLLILVGVIVLIFTGTIYKILDRH